jgi:hypothetical protein
MSSANVAELVGSIYRGCHSLYKSVGYSGYWGLRGTHGIDGSLTAYVFILRLPRNPSMYARMHDALLHRLRIHVCFIGELFVEYFVMKLW